MDVEKVQEMDSGDGCIILQMDLDATELHLKMVKWQTLYFVYFIRKVTSPKYF